MNRALRVASTASGVLLILVGLGFAVGLPAATGLWPWTDGRLTYLFIGAVGAAAGSGLLWIGLEGEPAMFQPFALDAVVVALAGAVLNGLLYASRRDAVLLGAAIVGGVAAVGYLALYLWSRRFSFRDPRHTPMAVRSSFAVFVVALLLTGAALLAGVDHIFPWPLKSESSTFFGWVLLASALYYGYGVVRPNWDNAGPQLLAFLIYDAILIVPFIGRFSEVTDADRPSLIVYTAVIVYSGFLATYYLLLNPDTRVWSSLVSPATDAQPRLR